jgi:hypothetical protein
MQFASFNALTAGRDALRRPRPPRCELGPRRRQGSEECRRPRARERSWPRGSLSILAEPRSAETSGGVCSWQGRSWRSWEPSPSTSAILARGTRAEHRHDSFATARGRDDRDGHRSTVAATVIAQLRDPRWESGVCDGMTVAPAKLLWTTRRSALLRALRRGTEHEPLRERAARSFYVSDRKREESARSQA